MISDRYSGLSSPAMEEIDADAVKVAMLNITRYIDLMQVRPVLDSSNTARRHPNRFLEELGLTATSTVCETNHTSTVHPIHGDFDLFWNGVITDYKTGKAKTVDDIVRDMTMGSGAKYPEFQPLIYLALASEMKGSNDGFNLFYAMENDVESSDDDYDIGRNMRPVRIRRETLMECMTSSEDLIADLEEDLSRDFKPHVREILDTIASMAVGDPEDWKSDQALVDRIASIAGVRGKNAEKSTRTAIGKIAARLRGGMLINGRSVDIPRSTLDSFLLEVDRMHDEAVAGSLTDLPATPRIECRKCRFYEACTREVLPVNDSGDDTDE